MYATQAFVQTDPRVRYPHLRISEGLLYRYGTGSVGDNHNTGHLPAPFHRHISGVLLDNLHLLMLLGLLPTAASLTLYFSGLAQVRAQNASIIALLEPASAVVFAATIMSQPITSSVLVGRRADTAGCAGG
jgi:hypothetical protein